MDFAIDHGGRRESTDSNRPKRVSVKSNRPDWKQKLRQYCLTRVKEEKAQLLSRIRSNCQQDLGKKEINAALREIVSDGLQKFNKPSVDERQRDAFLNNNDLLWEYDGSHVVDSNEAESEELMLEMERLLYEDLREEMIRKELEFLEEEDEYLAQAVFENMNLNGNSTAKDDRLWCPICKQGELKEIHHLIYCTNCSFRLDLINDQANLDFLRHRLAEVHIEHLDRGCKAPPKFSTQTMFNLTALYIQCEECSIFEVVV